MNDAWKKALEARKSMEIKQKNPLEKFQEKPTRATAINAFCFECMGGGCDSGFRWMIGNCTNNNCTLYPFRPYKTMEGKKPPKNLEL